MLYDCLVNCYLKRHNEKLISKGYMKMFLATEALELRYSLEIMQIYHAINLVFLPMGVIMKILDLIFLLLTFLRVSIVNLHHRTGSASGQVKTPTNVLELLGPCGRMGLASWHWTGV